MTNNLLRTKRFLPLLVTQFLGALNDNLFKNALLMLVTIKMTEQSDILSNVIAGLFILPFFLFSATAGQIADKYPRDKIARILKITEIILILGVGVAYLFNSIWFLIFVLGLMGAQSAFFGPVKYALLPQQLEQKELVAGNAYIESTTYAAILLGLILGTLLPTPVTISILIFFAVCGYAASCFIPYAPSPRPDSMVNKNILKSTLDMLSFIKKYKLIFTCILGASWFWIIGALVVVQIYPIVGKILNASEGVITFFLIIFSAGVAVGSFLCSKILKGFIHATYVPLSALGMGLSMFFIYICTDNYPTPEISTNFIEFFGMPHAFAISFNLFMLAFWGGLYIIPLNAMMQSRAPKAYVATVIAGNNIFNALGMVLVALFAVVFIYLGFTIPQLFLLMAILSLFVTGYICILLPDAFTRSIVQSLLGFLFKSKVSGLNNFKRAGKRVLIVSNHVSLLDGVLLAAFMPERITFAINTEWTRKWFMPITRLLVDFYPIDPSNPLSVRALIEEVKKGRKVMIFPEGRVTTTGAMMKVYEGAGIIAAKANAKILPVRIDGAQYSKFSYLKNKFKSRWFPKITLSIMEAENFTLPQNSKSGRYAVSKHLYDLMSDMMYKTSDLEETVWDSFMNAALIHGKNHGVIGDIKSKTLSYKTVIKRVLCVGGIYKKLFKDNKNIAIYLPPSCDAIITFLALQYAGKIPVMANEPIIGIPVISSKGFIKDSAFETADVTYIEDIGYSSLMLIKERLCSLFCKKGNIDIRKTAVSFYNIGKEIELSHFNIQSAYQQFSGVFPLNKTDVTVSSLPISNPFGFIYGSLIPILCGSKVFFYPQSKHYKAIPEICYDCHATFLAGDNNLFDGYAHAAHPYDFFTLKYVISAQGSLNETVYNTWVKKFGIRILEGYFSDKYATLISVNTPIYNRQGTFGCLLPGIDYKINEKTNELMVKGDNIHDGSWQNMEEVVEIDEEGYLIPII